MAGRVYLPALDGLRGIAIVAVIVHNVDLVHDLPSVAGRAIALSASLGWIGVQLFFALSGFLITGILLDSKSSPLYFKSFFARRVLRIFPIYYATLIVMLLIVPRLVHPAPDTAHQIWLWTYLSNWTWPSNQAVPYLSHFWSLAVEEQFYLVWPFVVRAVSARALGRTAIGLTLLAMLVRAGLRLRGIGPEEEYMWTICRMDALALGAWAAVHVRMRDAEGRPSIAVARWLVPSSALLIALAVAVSWPDPRTSRIGQTLGYTLLAVASTGFVLAAAAPASTPPRGFARLLGSGPLPVIGKYSYGMYVYHLPLHVFVGAPLATRWFGSDPTAGQGLAYIAAMAAVTFVVAAFSYELVESPFLRLKRRYVATPPQLLGPL